jgi:ERF superfamily
MATIPAQQSLAIDMPRRRETPLDLLSIALQNNAAIDVIERLASLQEKALARDSEIAFNEAMCRVQSTIRRVAPDLDNNQTHSKYASYAALDKAVRPVYSAEGISLSFDTDDCPIPEHVRCVCYVSLGAYTRKYKVDMPADGKGAKGGDVMTKTHAAGSAMSYGMRYLLKGIFNIAIGTEDNDGNGAPHFAELEERLEWIANCANVDELQKIFKSAYKEALAAEDTKALKALVAAKDKKRGELQ